MNYVHSEVVMNNRLSEAHVDSWRERGFALVHDLLPAALLHELKDDAGRFTQSLIRMRQRISTTLVAGKNLSFRRNPMRVIRSHCIHCCYRPLGTYSALRQLNCGLLNQIYGQSTVWVNLLTLLITRINVFTVIIPITHCASSEWHRPEAVEIIIYLNDFDECDGATAVVPDRGKMTRPILGQSSTRQEWRGWTMSMTVLGPKLIWCSTTLRRQHFATTIFTLGSGRKVSVRKCVVLSPRYWHRGRPVKPGARRLVQNITFTKLGRDWLNVCIQDGAGRCIAKIS
ncbi:MAG: hypothetical protein CM15mP120_22870 [Pseudomonadota bacterium]|nr:MAG: hypothetical protein CM15mP120_22870 [Pseudomonadota bacterium]